MRIAFYAPLKPPTDPRPSGDRRMARLLMRALADAGHKVMLASRLRARDGKGDARRQERIRRRALGEAARLIARWKRARPWARPRAWFTYHLYHKAPDWIGPVVSAALRIPYVVAEPSVAPKQRDGKWRMGYAASVAAMRCAHALLCLTGSDARGVRAVLRDDSRLRVLAPFLDAAPYGAAAARRAKHRRALARALRLPSSVPWLLAVGRMRPGNKLASYRVLARAMARLKVRDFVLLVVGDGPARRPTRAALKALGAKVRFLGARSERALPAIYAAADLYVWPSVREAYGMAVLEAQATGLPVAAGRGVGVGDIVAHGKTGLLVKTGDAKALAAAAARLLGDARRRRAMRAAALARVRRHHDIVAASRAIHAALQRAAGACR